MNERRLKSSEFSEGLHIRRIYRIQFFPLQITCWKLLRGLSLCESPWVFVIVCVWQRNKKWETHSRNSTANCHFLPLLPRVWAAARDLCVSPRSGCCVSVCVPVCVCVCVCLDVLVMYAGKPFCLCIKTMTECIFFDAARSWVCVTEAERKRLSESPV